MQINLGLVVLGMALMAGIVSRVGADEIANILTDGTYFLSESGEARVALGGQGKRFEVWLGNRVHYTSLPGEADLRLGVLYISNDAQVVVWCLAEHFYGEIKSGMPGILFYKHGKLLKRYNLDELLVRSALISRSVSHTQWVMEIRNADFSPGPSALQFSPDGSRLELETTSFRHYVFDPRTGGLKLAEDSRIYQEADLIVYGEMKSLSHNWFKSLGVITRYGIIKGKPSTQPLKFKDATATYNAGWHTIALKHGAPDTNAAGEVWEVMQPAYRLPVIYNDLPSQK